MSHLCAWPVWEGIGQTVLSWVSCATNLHVLLIFMSNWMQGFLFVLPKLVRGNSWLSLVYTLSLGLERSTQRA